MEVASLRPKLVSFRATSFHGENKAVSSGQDPWNFQLTQEIEVGLAVANEAPAQLLGIVKINLLAKAAKADAADQIAEFSASYEAKFNYPAAVTETQIAPLIDTEAYQYVLTAQVFPLAMTHFRREMQSLGFDARNMPLGM
jgi:hypothetical protein